MSVVARKKTLVRCEDSPFLHAEHLVSVLVSQLGVDAFVDAHRVHGERDGQKAVHLLVLFVDLQTGSQNRSRTKRKRRSSFPPHHLIFIRRLLEHVSGPLDVQEDVGEDSNGILVAPHHQIGEAHVVVGSDLTLGNS